MRLIKGRYGNQQLLGVFVLHLMASLHAQLGFTEQEVRDLQFVFSVFDPGGRGTVDSEDLRHALRVLGFRVSRRAAQEIMRDVGVQPRAARADWEGFLQAVARLQGSGHDTHQEILQAFQYLDCDGDQMLSVEDLKRACSDARLQLSKADIQGMMEEADKDGDGLVSPQEFVQVMCRTHLFHET